MMRPREEEDDSEIATWTVVVSLTVLGLLMWVHQIVTTLGLGCDPPSVSWSAPVQAGLPPVRMFGVLWVSLFIWNAALFWRDAATDPGVPHSTRVVYALTAIALASILFVLYRVSTHIREYDRLDAIDGVGAVYPSALARNRCWEARPFVGTWQIAAAGGTRPVRINLQRNLEFEVWEDGQLVAKGTWESGERGVSLSCHTCDDTPWQRPFDAVAVSSSAISGTWAPGPSDAELLRVSGRCLSNSECASSLCAGTTRTAHGSLEPGWCDPPSP